MESLLMIFGNSTEEKNYEEMNLWYGWVHIRDVLTMKAANAVQRFELSDYQPKNADLSHKVLACYEIPDVNYCNVAHLKRLSSWKMDISTSFDTLSYIESHWLPLDGASRYNHATWQEFADYAGDKGIFTVKLKAKSDVQVKDYFDFEMLKKLAALPGFTACHLFEYHEEIQMPVFPPPVEPWDCNLVCQINNCYAVAREWDNLLDSNPEIAEKFEMSACVFKPMMDRIRDIELFKCAEWRAIQALAHLIQVDKEGRINPRFEDIGVDIADVVPQEILDIPNRDFFVQK